MHHLMTWYRSSLFACLGLLCALPACRHKKTPPPLQSELNAWPTITPAEAGMDAAKLKAFSDTISGNGVVIRHDKLAYTWGKEDQALDVASASKPVMVHLVFKAVEEGLIGGIDDPVAKWEPGLAALNPNLNHKDLRMTWRHLMNQTSAYGLTEEPGTSFAYNDFQSMLFWEVLMQKVYKSAPDEAGEKVLRPQLFDLIGAQDKPTYRVKPPPGVSGRLVISPRDFARVGLVYLHGGQWQGRQVIEKKWVDLALHSPLPLSLPRTTGKDAEMLPGARTMGGTKDQEENLGAYSFMWWLNKPDAKGRLLWPDVPADAYCAAGHGGVKVLMVIPSLDMVVVWANTTLQNVPMCGVGRDQINEAMKKMLAAVR